MTSYPQLAAAVAQSRVAVVIEPWGGPPRATGHRWDRSSAILDAGPGKSIRL